MGKSKLKKLDQWISTSKREFSEIDLINYKNTILNEEKKKKIKKNAFLEFNPLVFPEETVNEKSDKKESKILKKKEIENLDSNPHSIYIISPFQESFISNLHFKKMEIEEGFTVQEKIDFKKRK